MRECKSVTAATAVSTAIDQTMDCGKFVTTKGLYPDASATFGTATLYTVFLPLSSFLIAFSIVCALSAAAGVWLSGIRNVARKLLPASGLIIIAAALLLLLPELAHTLGWPAAAIMLAASLAIVWAVDRFVYPVCPLCSHSHDHEGCSTRLHGFAPPLLIAMLIHNAFDGWMLAMGQGSLSMSVFAHKVPECLAFGAILAAALPSRRTALASAMVTQAGTFAGVGLHSATAAWLPPLWMAALLAIGGGLFLYLGFHAVHGEWKRRTSVLQNSAANPLTRSGHPRPASRRLQQMPEEPTRGSPADGVVRRTQTTDTTK